MPIATGASVSFTVVVNEQGVQEINQLAAAVSGPANENYEQHPLFRRKMIFVRLTNDLRASNMT
jgi:hypothetical protein